MVLAVNEAVVVGWLLLGWLLPLGFQTFVAPSLSLRLSRSSWSVRPPVFLRSAALSTETRCADESRLPFSIDNNFHTQSLTPLVAYHNTISHSSHTLQEPQSISAMPRTNSLLVSRVFLTSD